ncbi:cation-transporting P-type ATPase [Piscirickettsia litoralis]|nr:cation-transporting P-type ATPase [Piscirickettsia litoralis]
MMNEKNQLIGLTQVEAQKRLAEYGDNVLDEKKASFFQKK